MEFRFSVISTAVCLMIATSSIEAAQQQLGVKGKVICPSHPAKAHNVKVYLVDKDTGIDDSLGMALIYGCGKTKTDKDGNFQLSGTAFDLVGNVDVQLKIYHKCLVGSIKGALCERRLAYKLPNTYLTPTADGKDKMKTIDMGIINLEPEPRKEDSCNFNFFG